MDAGGFAKPAGQRPAMTKPIPRRSFLRRAGRTAGGSERRPSDEGRAAGGGDAATTPQAAHQLKELLKPSRMDAAMALQPLDHPTRVRAPPQSIPGAFARRSNRRAAPEVMVHVTVRRTPSAVRYQCGTKQRRVVGRLAPEIRATQSPGVSLEPPLGPVRDDFKKIIQRDKAISINVRRDVVAAPRKNDRDKVQDIDYAITIDIRWPHFWGPKVEVIDVDLVIHPV